MRLEHRIRLVVVAATAMILLAACGSTSSDTTASSSTTTAPASASLIGEWERTGGNYSVLQGMVVEVAEPGTEGVVVTVPRNPYDFRQGDVKWVSIVERPNGEFRFSDLSRESGTGAVSYVVGFMTLANDGQTLEMRFPSTGTIQVWTRGR
jgi:ABC-type Fe3+-hydroxamate transport system substrate-binding protein